MSEFLLFGGGIFALIGGISALGSLLTGVAPTKWPEPAIGAQTDPDRYRQRLTAIATISAVGIVFALLGLLMRYI